MNKKEFMLTMERLWDNGERISLVVAHDPIKRRKAYATDRSGLVMKCVVAIRKAIAAKKYPFDVDVVSVKDILESSKTLKAFSHVIIGRALREIGAFKFGQVLDTAGNFTRVWVIRNHEKLNTASPAIIQQIFNRSQNGKSRKN